MNQIVNKYKSHALNIVSLKDIRIQLAKDKLENLSDWFTDNKYEIGDEKLDGSDCRKILYNTNEIAATKMLEFCQVGGNDNKQTTIDKLHTGYENLIKEAEGLLSQNNMIFLQEEIKQKLNSSQAALWRCNLM